MAARDGKRCVRCSMPGNQWHHRRTRDVVDKHRHCPCNGVTLCLVCHAWVHANPLLALEQGWIVSSHVASPGEVSVKYRTKVRWLSCNGGIEGLSGPEVESLNLGGES